MTILITAATSSEAYRLKKQLNGDIVILGDYLELPAFMLKNNDMIRLPNPASTSYTHEMLTLCLNNEVGKLYILRDEELNGLREAEQLFKEYGIEITNAR